MHMNPELLRYFQEVNNCLQYQNQQIQQLNAKLDGLLQQMDQWKQSGSQPAPQPQPPVIRNEYHFDLLKVEKLEGTLNIGINPNGTDGNIDEMSVGQSVDAPPMQSMSDPSTGTTIQNDPVLYESVREQVHEYLRGDAFQALKAFEAQYRYPLDEPYRKFIVDDVKKQIDKRIRYYINKLGPEHVPGNPELARSIRQSITDEVKRDIEKTFEAFIKNLPGKDG